MKRILAGALSALRYLENRLGERSFWLMIGAAVIPAAALKYPFNVLALSVSAMAALVPDGSVKPSA